MSGEAIVVRGTVKTLESNGAQITSGAVVVASIAGYNAGTDGASYPDAEFVFEGTFATAPASNATVNLYAAPLALDGALNADAPETTRPVVFVGTFGVKAGTALQTIPLTGMVARDLPLSANYYLHNNTAVTLNAGWVLKITPRSYKAAP